jgi:hypothetical protein
MSGVLYPFGEGMENNGEHLPGEANQNFYCDQQQ